MTVTWLRETAADLSAKSKIVSNALASLLCAQGLILAVHSEMEQGIVMRSVMMEIRILEMGAAKMVKFSLDTNAQHQTSLAYLLIQTSAETGLLKMMSNATTETLTS